MAGCSADLLHGRKLDVVTLTRWFLDCHCEASSSAIGCNLGFWQLVKVSEPIWYAKEYLQRCDLSILVRPKSYRASWSIWLQMDLIRTSCWIEEDLKLDIEINKPMFTLRKKNLSWFIPIDFYNQTYYFNQRSHGRNKQTSKNKGLTKNIIY